MKVFVINLDSEVKRRAFQEKQLQTLRLDYTIVTATSINDIDEKTYQKHYYDWQRPLRVAEIACYFSHRNIWQKVITDNQPALVLEDDVLLSKNLPVLLPVLEKCTDIDLVDLEVFGRKKNVSKIGRTLVKDSKLFKLYYNSAGAAGYIVYPTGAKKLLEHENSKGISLADAHIANCNSVNAFQVEPAAVVQFILCPHYNINKKEYDVFSTSSTYSQLKIKKEFIFRIKRVLSEIKLGIYKLRLIFISKRRYIILNKEHFSDIGEEDVAPKFRGWQKRHNGGLNNES